MSLTELIVIFIVGIIVFGPSKLPMLAEHLGKLYKKLADLKSSANTVWQEQLDQIQLKQNTEKAKAADKAYKIEDAKLKPNKPDNEAT